jgi:hypothetical protein
MSTQLKEVGYMWDSTKRQKQREFGNQKMYSGMFVGHYGDIQTDQTSGRFAADGEPMYETEATEQTANTLREFGHSAQTSD